MEERIKSTQGLLDNALTLLAAKNPEQALQTLTHVDLEIQDLEHVKALCFIELNKIEDAYRSLQKELKNYPDNTLAQELYVQLVEEMRNQPQTSPLECEEFKEIYRFCKQCTDSSVDELFRLYQTAKEICEKKIPGNFLQLGTCDGSVFLLGIVIAHYSTMPRWVYVLDGGMGNVISPKDMMDIAAKVNLGDLIKPLNGKLDSIPALQKEWVGMLSLIQIGVNVIEQRNELLAHFKGNLLEGGKCFVETQGVTYTQPDHYFQINREIDQRIVEEFKADDVIKLGVVSQMCLNERFQLFYAVRHHVQPHSGTIRFIEVGSFAGGSLLMSYLGLRRQGCKIQGYAVEPFGELQFYKILDRLKDDVTHLKMFSHEASQQIKQDYLQEDAVADFILIDGDHTYEGVRQDIIDFYPLLRKGGIILFHDYLPHLNDENRPSIYFHHGDKEPGIRQAVDELIVNEYKAKHVALPLLRPTDPTQTQAHLPIIPEVHSTVRIYQKV